MKFAGIRESRRRFVFPLSTANGGEGGVRWKK